jgi:hypothetical protein
MRAPSGRIRTVFQAFRELGLRPMLLLGLYRLGLLSGYLRWRTPCIQPSGDNSELHFPLDPPTLDQLQPVIGDHAADLIAEADQLNRGKVRLFGQLDADLQLTPPDSTCHWSRCQPGKEDIKLLWEPARFGWAFTLMRAYILTGDNDYPETFWRHLELFVETNPPNCGLNWSSGQEVALRLLAFLFAARVFAEAPSSTPARQSQLAAAVVAHARRIPPTLIYARAQDNNHLLTEALGLYAAGCSLPDHPEAKRWLALGWRWANHALQRQIDPDGVYIQHSTNYHRLMLQAALCLQALAASQGQTLPNLTLERLGTAARWLAGYFDPHSGRAVNLGHNDGAHILPLAAGDYGDYRPTLQAAARAFLGQSVLGSGPWNEPALWYNLAPDTPSLPFELLPISSAVHRLGDGESWGVLRAVRFKGRPAHADQLHVDLWWQGHNIARDAGTYHYNLPPTWDNALARTAVHNTITINGQDQMRRAGRFLWLQRAQARLLPNHSEPDSISAEHDGYQRLGILHRRTLTRTDPHNWQVVDTLTPTHHPENVSAVLHWLLPDWSWELHETTLHLQGPPGKVRLHIGLVPGSAFNPPRVTACRLIHAGQLLVGDGPTVNSDAVTAGWFSPTYAVKEPALSLQVVLSGAPPFSILSEWHFTVK